MRYVIISDIGGFLWWVLVKFCKTKLEDEQMQEKWGRNILFFIFVGMIVAYIAINFF